LRFVEPFLLRVVAHFRSPYDSRPALIVQSMSGAGNVWRIRSTRWSRPTLVAAFHLGGDLATSPWWKGMVTTPVGKKAYTDSMH
jgi:hypothetical protein